MPRPPPPALALTMMGYPCCRAKTSASSSWAIGSGVPGTIGTPAAAAALRPATLSPSRRCISAVGPTKTIPARVAGLREVGVLGEEAVAGVDRVHLEPLRERDDLVDAEVGVDGRLPLADEVRLVRLVAVQREAVLLRVDRRPSGSPSPVQARKMRIAISPRFAAMTLLNGTGMSGSRERSFGPPGDGGRGFEVVRCWPPFARGSGRRKRGSGRAVARLGPAR